MWNKKKSFWLFLDQQSGNQRVAGIPPLTLYDAKENSLQYLKAYGATGYNPLPDGYAHIEYLKSNSYQYINTGVDAKDIYKFEISILVGSVTGALGSFAGGRVDTTGITMGISNDGLIIDWGSRYTFGNILSPNTRYKIVAENQTVTIYNEETDTQVATHNYGTNPTDATAVYLFGLNNNGTASLFQSTAQIYNAKIYTSANTLAHNYIGVRTIPAGILGMYDTVTGTFSTNAGAGTFGAGQTISAPLPFGYKQLKYIGCSGTQAVDTGVAVKNVYNMDLRFVITYKNPGATGSYFFGGRTSGYTGITVGYEGATLVFDYQGIRWQPSGSYNVDTPYHIEFINNRVSLYNDVNGQRLQTYVFTGVNRTDTNPLGVLCYDQADTLYPSANCYYQVSELVLYGSSALEAYYIPAEDSDGVAGFYDLVSGMFKTNEGTGDFTKGAYMDVPSVQAPKQLYCNNGVLTVNNLGNIYAAGLQETIGLDIAPTNTEKYLVGHGTEIIDTAITGSSVYGYDIKFTILGLQGGIIFGAREQGANGTGVIIGHSGSGNNYYLYVDWFMNSISDRYQPSYSLVPNVPYRATMIDNVFTLYNYTTGAVLATHIFTPTHHTVARNCYLYGDNNGGTAQVYPKGMAVEYLKLYDSNGDLLCDMHPVNTGTECCMVDYVSGTLVTNSGTGNFTVAPDSVYTPVEYIESDGTQYIDTGTAVKDIYKLEFDFMINESGNIDGGSLFGGRNGANYNGVVFAVFSNTTVLSLDWGSRVSTGINPTRLNQYKLVVENKTASLYNMTTNTLAWSYTYPARSTHATSLYLFGILSGWDKVCFSKHLQVRRCKIWYDADTLLHDFIPVVDANGVAGMYDPVQEMFFGNAGTGSFTAGNKISATCEMLLGVPQKKDIQEVLAGSVTKNCGAIALDGTETWDDSTVANCYALAIGSGNFTDRSVISTHFETVATEPGTNDRQGKAFIYNDSTNYGIAFGATTDFATVADWQTFLAEQYAAGTPVMVVYPLKTSTTDTVTAQPINIFAGTNGVDITQASVANLELELEYQTQTE